MKGTAQMQSNVYLCPDCARDPSEMLMRHVHASVKPHNGVEARLN